MLPTTLTNIFALTVYVITFAMFSSPFVLEFWSPASRSPMLLWIISITLRLVGIILNLILSTFSRALVEADPVFVFVQYLTFNITLISSFIIYVWEYLPRPVSIFIVITCPAILVLFETIFHAIVTHQSSLYLGYFARFHQGLWVTLKGIGLGLLVLDEGLGEGFCALAQGVGAGIVSLFKGVKDGLTLCCGLGDVVTPVASNPGDSTNRPPHDDTNPWLQIEASLRPAYFDATPIDTLDLTDSDIEACYKALDTKFY